MAVLDRSQAVQVKAHVLAPRASLPAVYAKCNQHMKTHKFDPACKIRYELEHSEPGREPKQDAMGTVYKQVGNSAFPVFVNPEAVKLLRTNFEATSSDVFLVFPAAPTVKHLEALAIALLEQVSVDDDEAQGSRLIEKHASIACKEVSPDGIEGAVKQIQDWAAKRRTFTTHAPPWLFPCKNAITVHRTGGDADDLGALDGDAFMEVEVMKDGPRIAVFVADPRCMLMRDLHMSKLFHNPDSDIDPDMTSFVEHFIHSFVGNDIALHGGSNRTSVCWAHLEAQCPDRVRLFFIEDFVLQPEIAVRGLAKFLGVSMVSDTTERAINQAVRILRVSQQVGEPSPSYEELSNTISVGYYVTDFERILARASNEAQQEWDSLVDLWLLSPNSQMATMAAQVKLHEMWSPPRWWAAHNALACRPCVFFPRGTCRDEDCQFCHGGGHAARTKRPSRAVRKQRKRGDRTPSPDGFHSEFTPSLPSISDVGSGSGVSSDSCASSVSGGVSSCSSDYRQ